MCPQERSKSLTSADQVTGCSQSFNLIKQVSGGSLPDTEGPCLFFQLLCYMQQCLSLHRAAYRTTYLSHEHFVAWIFTTTILLFIAAPRRSWPSTQLAVKTVYTTQAVVSPLSGCVLLGMQTLSSQLCVNSESAHTKDTQTGKVMIQYQRISNYIQIFTSSGCQVYVVWKWIESLCWCHNVPSTAVRHNTP